MAIYTTNDLSAAACFALTYAQALIAGPDSPRGKRFQAAQQATRMSGADMRAALAKGLAELREMGIIECQRDGEGDLVPTVLHEERIAPGKDGPRLVTGDLN